MSDREAPEIPDEFWLAEHDGSINRTTEHGTVDMDEQEVVEQMNTDAKRIAALEQQLAKAEAREATLREERNRFRQLRITTLRAKNCYCDERVEMCPRCVELRTLQREAADTSAALGEGEAHDDR